MEVNKPGNPNAEGRKALGRGLAALLNTNSNPSATPATPAKSSLVEKTEAAPVEALPAGPRLQIIELAKIEPNPQQPRKFFNEEKLQELARSLKEQGLIQPIVVKKMPGDKYQIIAGERRWRASKLAQLKEIHAIVREEEKVELDNDLASLAENIQREELNAIELGQAYERLIKIHQFTQEQLAEKLGVSRVSVANTLRLLKLPEDVQRLVIDGKLSEGHSRALLSLQSQNEISRMATEIVNEKLTVRDVESRVRMKIVGHNFQTPSVSGAGSPQNPPVSEVKKPEILALEEELRQVFGTKVAVRGAGDRGTIEIYYTGGDSLNRLLHLLRGLKK